MLQNVARRLRAKSKLHSPLTLRPLGSFSLLTIVFRATGCSSYYPTIFFVLPFTEYAYWYHRICSLRRRSLRTRCKRLRPRPHPQPSRTCGCCGQRPASRALYQQWCFGACTPRFATRTRPKFLYYTGSQLGYRRQVRLQDFPQKWKLCRCWLLAGCTFAITLLPLFLATLRDNTDRLTD